MNKRPKNATRWLLTFLIVFALCSCATTTKDGQKASNEGNVEAYEQILKDHPDDEKYRPARHQLEEIRVENEWEKAKSLNTIIGYRNFLEKHPQSKQASQASSYIMLLEIQQDWELACKIDTIEAYNNFTLKYPGEPYYDKIERRKKEIEKKEQRIFFDAFNICKAIAYKKVPFVNNIKYTASIFDNNPMKLESFDSEIREAKKGEIFMVLTWGFSGVKKPENIRLPSDFLQVLTKDDAVIEPIAKGRWYIADRAFWLAGAEAQGTENISWLYSIPLKSLKSIRYKYFDRTDTVKIEIGDK